MDGCELTGVVGFDHETLVVNKLSGSSSTGHHRRSADFNGSIRRGSPDHVRETTAPRENKARGAPSANLLNQLTSNLSRSITLVQAAAKSSANFCFASSLAYTSESARSCEFDPKTRSTAVAVYFGSPVARSTPS